MIYNIEADSDNYYNLIDREWKSIRTKIKKAAFKMCCNAIKVAGEYKSGQQLCQFNYLSAKVEVSIPGAFSIRATTTDPTKENGYYFTTFGEFLSIGIYTILVPGMGRPLKHTTPHFDNFTLILNGDMSTSSFDVEVKSSAFNLLASVWRGLIR